MNVDKAIVDCMQSSSYDSVPQKSSVTSLDFTQYCGELIEV